MKRILFILILLMLCLIPNRLKAESLNCVYDLYKVETLWSNDKTSLIFKSLKSGKLSVTIESNRETRHDVDTVNFVLNNFRDSDGKLKCIPLYTRVSCERNKCDHYVTYDSSVSYVKSIPINEEKSEVINDKEPDGGDSGESGDAPGTNPSSTDNMLLCQYSKDKFTINVHFNKSTKEITFSAIGEECPKFESDLTASDFENGCYAEGVTLGEPNSRPDAVNKFCSINKTNRENGIKPNFVPNADDIEEGNFGENMKSDPFEFGDLSTCVGFLGRAQDSGTVAELVDEVYDLLKIFIVILFVVLSMLEFTKAITANDSDALKKATTKLIYRLAIVIAILLIPTLIESIAGLFGKEEVLCGIG